MNGIKFKRKRNKKNLFNPNREFIKRAIKDFIKRGGHITRTVYAESENQERDEKAISEFLCDSGYLVARNYPDDYYLARMEF